MIVLYQKKLSSWIGLVLFTPDSRSLLTGSNDGGFIWRGLPKTDLPQSVPAVQYCRNALCSPDGKWLLTGGAGVFTDLTNLSTQWVEFEQPGERFFDITPDRRLLVAQCSRPDPFGWISSRLLADLSPKGVVWSRQTTHQFDVNPVCVADERFVLREWRREQRTVRYHTYSAKDGSPLATVERTEVNYPSSVASPNGQLLVALSSAQLFVLPANDLSKIVEVVKNPGRQHFTSIAFHPSGKYLGATSNDATVKLYDTTTWEVARTFTWDIGRMRSIAFSPDGTLAAAGSDKGKVVVWDVDL